MTAQSDQIADDHEAAAALAVFLYALLAKLRVRTSPDIKRFPGIVSDAVGLWNSEFQSRVPGSQQRSMGPAGDGQQ